MGLVTKIIDKVTSEKIFNNISSGIDKSVLTKEEIADMNMKIYHAQLEHAEKTLNSNSISSKARRILAFATAFTYLGGKITAMVLSLLNHIKASDINSYSDSIGIYFGGVMTYYFGMYVFNKIKEAKNKK